MASKNDKGILFDKEKETNKWYTDVISKCDLIEYTDVSGCYILKPKSQFMWDTIRTFMDAEFKKLGVKNASFPLLIPEKLLTKEEEHVEGFAPEVAWVTHAGSSKLSERLAIRPTSETIMYAAYSKWVRSYNDLPIRLNQWCSVVRWEFKNPMPFLRSREFYWQEGHTAFATKKEADDEAHQILDIYAKVYSDLLAIPVLKGKKSDGEKFAGADYSLSCEVMLPIGKAIQGGTSHHLGQNFSKAFDIKFIDRDEKEKFVYQNSWGLSTRSLGVMIMMHSDSKGLVIPPRVAENKVVIIPVLAKEGNDEILGACEKIKI
jgi:prolyl-tRNA synthetase